MILIGTDDGIYRWVEDYSWPIFHGLQDRSIVGLSAVGLSVAAVDRAGTVLESDDSGLSWRKLAMPRGITGTTAVAVVGSPRKVIAAVKPLGVFTRTLGSPNPRPKLVRPDTNATSFRKTLVPTVLYHSQSMAERAALLVAPKRVKPRADESTCSLGGWVPRNAPPASRDHVATKKAGLVVSPTEIRSLIAEPGTPETWFAAVSGSGLWKTTDAGGSWSQCAGLPREVHDVRLVPGRPGHTWAATQDGAWLTTDGGQTWEDRSVGLETTRHVRVIEIKPDKPDVLLAGCAPSAGMEEKVAPRQGLNFALFASADQWKTWKKVLKNFPETFESDTITDIRYDPANTDKVIVALGSGELWCTQNGGFYWSPLARQIRSARVLCVVS